LDAYSGTKGIVECAFVENSLTASPFFSTPVTLGPNGVEEVHSFGTLSAFEKEGLDKMLPDLIGQVKKGIEFAK